MMTAGGNWKNVNNWHWVEKNCLPWAQEYLREHLGRVEIEDAGARLNVTAVTRVEGDVDVNMRKGKVIYVFDVNIDMDWAGEKNGVKATGSVKLMDCSYDDDPKDYSVRSVAFLFGLIECRRK
jgi:activator of HSP90 ATPase